jgi:hypothetical protein
MSRATPPHQHLPAPELRKRPARTATTTADAWRGHNDPDADVGAIECRIGRWLWRRAATDPVGAGQRHAAAPLPVRHLGPHRHRTRTLIAGLRATWGSCRRRLNPKYMIVVRDELPLGFMIQLVRCPTHPLTEAHRGSLPRLDPIDQSFARSRAGTDSAAPTDRSLALAEAVSLNASWIPLCLPKISSGQVRRHGRTRAGCRRVGHVDGCSARRVDLGCQRSPKFDPLRVLEN